jgi:hypothetical protein
VVERTAGRHCSVETAVGRFNQRRLRRPPLEASEGVQSGERAIEGDLKDRALIEIASVLSSSIEGSIAGLNERAYWGSPVAVPGEGVKNGYHAIAANCEDDPSVKVAASRRRSVEVPVSRLCQRRKQLRPIWGTSKRVQDFEGTLGVNDSYEPVRVHLGERNITERREQSSLFHLSGHGACASVC